MQHYIRELHTLILFYIVLEVGAWITRLNYCVNYLHFSLSQSIILRPLARSLF